MAQWYRQALAKVLNKEADFDTDALKITLHTATYTPNLDTHAYQSNLTNELSTGSGYTSGGLAVTGSTPTYTAANSWGTAWVAATAYPVGRVIRPSTGNLYLYRAVAIAGTGTSAAVTEPTWPTTVGLTVVDNSGANQITWECVGKGILVLNLSADPSWASASFGPCRYAVLADTTPGTSATNPLLSITDFVSDRTGGGGAFTISRDSQGWLHLFMP